MIGTSLIAQTSSDPDAKKILDAVSEKFKSFKAIQAGFTYKVENADGKAISTKKGTAVHERHQVQGQFCWPGNFL